MIYTKPKRKPKIGRRILLSIIILIVFIKIFTGNFEINETIIIKKGDNFSKFTEQISMINKIRIKRYAKNHDVDFGKLKQGSYSFSGKYSPASFIKKIIDGPTQNFVSYTVLEGWSIYDIDENLTNKGYISKGDYINFVSDQQIISKYKSIYHFLDKIQLKNLEGFLYPDTYHVDANKDFIDQLVYLQLETFKKRVWNDFAPDFVSFESRLKNNGIRLSIPMNTYNVVTLASIVEKEERNKNNKATVAGIFLKRLGLGMRIDADITLCYGLAQSYKSCTPSFIAKNISDTNNVFNTRQKTGLTPMPIANPSVTSIKAVLMFEPSDYLFYLHDNEGKIHYGRNVSEHNQNKQNFLR